MASLIVKKLLQLPIGVMAEITQTDGNGQVSKLSGILTGNDYESNIEIKTDSGEEVVLDYSLVRSIFIKKSLPEIIRSLQPETEIVFSYGDKANRDPELSGKVIENDTEESSIEIRLQSGQELILSHTDIQSLLIESGSICKKEPEKQAAPSEPAKNQTEPSAPPQTGTQTPAQQKATALPEKPQKSYHYTLAPTDVLNVSDRRLKELFDSLPREDKRKLNGAYDSFRYGIKTATTDPMKMINAANSARRILLDEAENGYAWTETAVFFCGCLLRRAKVNDYKALLVANCYYEASIVCWKTKEYLLGGLYSALALLEGNPNTEDLLIVLSTSIVNGNDASCLPVLKQYLPEEKLPHLNTLIKEAFAAKGIALSVEQDTDASLQMLATLYPNTAVREELVKRGFDGRQLHSSEEAPPEKEAPEKEEPQSPEKPKKAELPEFHGSIVQANWADKTGKIIGEDTETYKFAYKDLADSALQRKIEAYQRADMNGAVYFVKFRADGSEAKEIVLDNSLVDRARAIAADSDREGRFETAFELCVKAITTADARRALVDMVKYGMALHKATGDESYVSRAVDLVEKNITYFPNNAFNIIELAQCYSYLKRIPQVIEFGEKAINSPGLEVKQKINLLSTYLRMLKEAYDVSGDKALLERMLNQAEDLNAAYQNDFASDTVALQQYNSVIPVYQVIALCGLDRLGEAEETFTKVPVESAQREYLEELLEKTRKRLAPPEQEGDAEEQPPEFFPDSEEYALQEEEEIVPYEDTDGWDALGLTKEEVARYALSITGDARIPEMAAYLRAAASLNPKLLQLYHTVALAANDPLEDLDYSVPALYKELVGGDTEYGVLNELCLGAAFLRSAFCAAGSYDFSAKSLRDSIAAMEYIPSLLDACETIDQFRKEVGLSIDIYADYRYHDVNQLKKDLEDTVKFADELYTKFVVSPARDSAKFARLVETKRIAFARDGYLATMLELVKEQNHNALEEKKDAFVKKYLKGTPQFSAKHLDQQQIDQIIIDSWELAGKTLSTRGAKSTLQGDRRNNLRSNISEILGTVCRWYALSEQSAGLTWRTEQGEATYQKLRPQLLEQLRAVEDACNELREGNTDLQQETGLCLVAATAHELAARLEGTWHFGQEKFFYVDFLRSNHIMLDSGFMPELSSTFCVLPDFNVLHRIRSHIEGSKRSFQEQIEQIYGMDKTSNNYGNAARIVEYFQAMGNAEQLKLPEKPELFVSHTEMQIELRYRSFRETYALANNYGQIIKSDAFCYSLEDTVRYWYSFCKESKNYGFFINLLQHAEEQIHQSARQYEEQLEEQMDALEAKNLSYFKENPDYSEAIRMQIANQNFTVAEDWMARIRIGDFSLNVEQQEALGYLESFWNSFVAIYNQVFDIDRPLSSLLNLRDDGLAKKDVNRAQMLLENWLSGGKRAKSNPAKIGQLLNLLGWKNIDVEKYTLRGAPSEEIYEVRKQQSETSLAAPLHPIAAYGSELETKPMHVACLYGSFDCDRLLEKIRVLDTLRGSKVILLNYALGQVERRALARKLKQRESGLRNVYIVIDRVMIAFLAKNYNESLINRILMAVAMPFSYYQPYVVESVLQMPPEIFMGRKDELLKVEQLGSESVNLIYGGRQLGKSALFKKAVADVDGFAGQRAVLVDIKELECAAAALKVSRELIDLGVTPGAEPTEDWGVLCSNIKQRLRNTEDEITYFLLMLDEADSFINDCANCSYRPLVELKDVQQSLPGRFKYVLAGLHNIIRFNRQVALGNNAVITQMPSLKITPFHTPEAQELLTYPLSYLGFDLPSKVTISQILATCNYFPGLIQLYAKKLLLSMRAADYAGYDVKKTPPYAITDAHLRRVMSDKEFVEQIYEKFEITLTLDQDQGSCYYPLTLLIGWMSNIAPDKNGYTAKDVLYHAKDLNVYPLVTLDEEKIDALLQELQDLNILRSVSNNSYLLASKNFRDLLGSDEEILEKLSKVGGAPN